MVGSFLVSGIVLTAIGYNPVEDKKLKNLWRNILGLALDLFLYVSFLDGYMVPTQATKIDVDQMSLYFIKMFENIVFIIPSECPNIEYIIIY